MGGADPARGHAGWQTERARRRPRAAALALTIVMLVAVSALVSWKQLVRDDEWAQEVQREINEERLVCVRTPQRDNKLYLVTLSKSWQGLHEHLMDHALLKTCMDELEQAGYPFKLLRDDLLGRGELQSGHRCRRRPEKLPYPRDAALQASIEEAAFDIICALVSLAVSRAKSASSNFDNLKFELFLTSRR